MRSAGNFPNTRYESCYDEVHSGPPYTDGGPFNKWAFTTNCTLPSTLKTFTGKSASYDYKYVGGFIPNFLPTNSWFGDLYAYYKLIGSQPVFKPNGTHSWGDVSSYGASAWKKFRPGKPAADAAVFIGEIRDLPRMLKTTARAWRDAYVSRFGRRPKAATKKAADHWLNTQFGWLPFLNDLRKFHRTWTKADKIIAYLVRNNGRWIKRGGAVKEEELETETLASYSDERMYPVLTSQYFPSYPSRGSAIVQRITRQKVWFEALFRYYIPNINSVTWRDEALSSLYGLNVTPELIWELTPWSWLVDWFTNVGDVLSNMSGAGPVSNLTAKYAYVMGTTETLIRLTSFAKLSPPTVGTWEYSVSRKSRVEANPFGFGVTWESLTPRQWSILGALGITRLV
jgi:hypothetical protein